jgi:hypothetical protein
MTLRHEITVLAHNFRVKPVIGLCNMLTYYFVKQQHKERKRKSSSGTSPIGSQTLNGYIPSASATSLISFSSHNFRVKPVIGLCNMLTYYFVKQKHIECKRKSSSGIPSPFGSQAFNGYIPTAEFAVSVI